MLKDAAKMYYQGDINAADRMIQDRMGTKSLNMQLCEVPTVEMGQNERIATLITRIAFLMGS